MSLPNVDQVNYDFSGVTQYLFNRSWSVAVGTPGQPGLLYTLLRTTFDITKTSDSSSNKCKVEVYNFNDQSRKKYVKGMQMTLTAGYVGLVETLFLGNIIRVHNQRKGPDIITEFECGDGEQQLYNNFINKSYPPGVTLVQLVQDLLNTLGLTVGTVAGLPNKVFNSGFVASGSIKDILDRNLKAVGLEWSVQNGTVQVIPIGSHNGETAIVVSQDSGLIGVPTPGNGGDNIVSFTSLLNPKLTPGAPVNLVSTQFNGLYKIRTSHFEGDSHDMNKWQVTCEAEPLTDRTVVPAQNKGTTIMVSP